MKSDRKEPTLLEVTEKYFDSGRIQMRELLKLIPSQELNENMSADQDSRFIVDTSDQDHMNKCEQLNKMADLTFKYNSQEFARIWLDPSFKIHTPFLFTRVLNKPRFDKFIQNFPDITYSLITDQDLQFPTSIIRSVNQQRSKVSSDIKTNLVNKLTAFPSMPERYFTGGITITDGKTQKRLPHRVAAINDILAKNDLNQQNAKEIIKLATNALNHTRAWWLPRMFRPQDIKTRYFYINTIKTLVASGRVMNNAYYVKEAEKFIEEMNQKIKKIFPANDTQNSSPAKPEHILKIEKILSQGYLTIENLTDIAMLVAEAIAYPDHGSKDIAKLDEDILDFLVEPYAIAETPKHQIS